MFQRSHSNTQTPNEGPRQQRKPQNAKTRNVLIPSIYLENWQLLIICIINILNYFKTLQESQHHPPTLDENPQYQNATISLIQAPISTTKPRVVYTQVLILFSTLIGSQETHLIPTIHKDIKLHNLNSYKLIFPNLKFTSQASISTKQSNFLGYSFIITPFKTIETINSTQEKKDFNLPQNPFHHFKTSHMNFYGFP